MCAACAAADILYRQPATTPSIPSALISQPQSGIDDVYEYHDPQANPLPQRQQQSSTPPRHRPASSGSSGARVLRRTPRLEGRAGRYPTPPFVAEPPQSAQRFSRGISIDQSGSTTPQSFARLVETDQYWPQRSKNISRRTHDAILFALEAIRKGRGVDAHPLTEYESEEEARMSDLVRGTQPSGPATGRAQNGASRPAQGSGPTPTEPPRYRTPTDVMRDRRLREQRKAEQELQRLQVEEQDVGRRQQEESAGVEGEQPQRRQQPTQSYNIGGEAPQPTQQSSRRQETIAAAPQAQPRPPNSQQPASYAPGHARLSSNTQRNRTEAFDTLNVPATAKSSSQQQPQASNINPSQSQTQQQQQPRTAFPHAFERWESLSASWEGLTSFWIRRLQENSRELEGKPIEQQLSRQISDLSAAGANLFHAVVELQRLRASSERKFQRWFFETRNEQEQAAERQAQLERELHTERDTRMQLQGRDTSGSSDAVQAEKARAEEALREMRRELQISKEEARRAWEELGRREQEERERTIALRSGEPTLIGGVHVVPMQGMSSRQASSAQRPVTQDGSYAGGAGPSTTGVQQQSGLQPPSRSQTTTTSLDSPGEETRQFNFQPQGTSPTSTDPFTESVSHTLHREPDTRFYTASPPRVTQPATSSAAIAAAARAAVSDSGQLPPTTNGTSSRQFYQQPSPQTTIHQPLSTIPTTSNTRDPRPRTATSSDQGRSYGPSTHSRSQSDLEEEYHINPDGSYTLDSLEQRIPYSQPLQRTTADPESEEGYGEDDAESEDYASDIARERAYLQQYASPTRSNQPQTISQQTQLQQSQSGNIQSGSIQPPPTSQAMASGALPQQQRPPVPGTQEAADYEGASFGPGWEGVTPRHRHPTRLSDILEEQTSRTSPSRASYVSGAEHARAMR